MRRSRATPETEQLREVQGHEEQGARRHPVASAARRMLAATFALALAAAGIVFAAHALRPDGSAEREHGSGAPADEGPTPNEIAPILDLPS